MDKAGAQMRLGEAKKSFAKAKAENAHYSTIYLASCFTDAVLSQLKTEREVDLHFNLIEILADEAQPSLPERVQSFQIILVLKIHFNVVLKKYIHHL